MRFGNKVCVVTGAASGIGRATALQMAREGGLVAVVDVNREGSCRTASQIEKEGGHAVCLAADVSDPSQVEGVVARVVDLWGVIDVLVNSAGVMTFEPITALSVDDWDRVLNINLRAAFLFAHHALPHIQNGAIVNVSSVHAHASTPNVSAYAASKAGLEALTRAISLEHAPDKVRANSVAPGAVDTPLLWSNPNLASGAEKLEGEIATPEQIAGAICFLASEDARFINGTTLRVDGGRLSQL